MYCEEWVDFADTILTQRGGTPDNGKEDDDGPSDTDNKPNQTTLSDRPRDRSFQL